MVGILDTINDAASSSGIDADYLARIAKIESGGNPRAVTGSYKGLFQLSPAEFQKHGGGDIFNAVDNARAAASMMANQRNEFAAKYGRPPTPTEAYMIHQQGVAGTDAHLANPTAPAWQNMASTGEGRQKGPGWAKQAIWGNIPDNLKAQFGNVNNVSSADFINMWRNKVEPGTAEPVSFPTQVAALGRQSTPAGVPLFAGSQSQPGQPQNPMAMAQTGLNMMQGQPFPAPPPLQPMQFAQLPRPRVDYSGLQAMLAGQKGFS